MATATTTTQAQLSASAQATAGTPAHALYAPSVAANIPNPAQIIQDALNPLNQIESFVVQQINWQRISKVVLGLVLVAIGAVGLTYTGIAKPGYRALFKTGPKRIDREVDPWAIRFGAYGAPGRPKGP